MTQTRVLYCQLNYRPAESEIMCNTAVNLEGNIDGSSHHNCLQKEEIKTTSCI